MNESVTHHTQCTGSREHFQTLLFLFLNRANLHASQKTRTKEVLGKIQAQYHVVMACVHKALQKEVRAITNVFLVLMVSNRWSTATLQLWFSKLYLCLDTLHLTVALVVLGQCCGDGGVSWSCYDQNGGISYTTTVGRNNCHKSQCQ